MRRCLTAMVLPVEKSARERWSETSAARSHRYPIRNILIPEVHDEIFPCRGAHERSVCRVEQPMRPHCHEERL